MSPSFGEQLIDAAAARYRSAGLWASRLASSKLRMDPVYLQVLRSGALPDHGTLVDLGCGRGLMLALIAAARDRYREGGWPADWPAPPCCATLIGVERRRRIASLARLALGSAATILESDVAGVTIPRCSAVFVFDVLHLLPANPQDHVLAACAAALERDGVLFVREADAAARAFRLVRLGNRTVAVLQGQPGRRFHYRTRTAWIATLTNHGFVVQADSREAPSGAPNLLFQARRASSNSFRPTSV